MPLKPEVTNFHVLLYLMMVSVQFLNPVQSLFNGEEYSLTRRQ